MTIYTLGHSTLSAVRFVEQIQRSPEPIELVLDVRSHPTSRHVQFQSDNFASFLRKARVGYEWVPPLGGWTAKDMSWATVMAPHGVDVAAYSKGAFPKQRIALKKPDVGQERRFHANGTYWSGVPTLGLLCDYCGQDAAFHTKGAMYCPPTWTNQGLYDYAWYMYLPEFNLWAEWLKKLGKERHVVIVCAEILWWKCHRSMIADWLVAHRSDAIHLGLNVPEVHSAKIGTRLDRYPREVREVWGAYGRD